MTNKREITITMPQESLDKWLAALESGEYKQGYRMLHDNTTGGYCCLGVLQHCLTGEVETQYSGGSLGLPSRLWLRKHKINFIDVRFPAPVLECRPTVAVEGRHLGVDHLNDSHEYSFADLAKLIRNHAKGT